MLEKPFVTLPSKMSTSKRSGHFLFWCDVVEVFRAVFEKLEDVIIYIPNSLSQEQTVA